MALDNLWNVQWNVTSAIRTHRSPNDLPIYCFLINAHIPWRTLVAWEDGSTRVYFAVLNHCWFGFSSFAVLSSSLHLWPCLRCGSENVVCSSKMKALCAEHSAEIGNLDRLRNGWSYSRISAEYGIRKSTVFDINMSMMNMCLAKLQACRILTGFSPDMFGWLTFHCILNTHSFSSWQFLQNWERSRVLCVHMNLFCNLIGTTRFNHQESSTVFLASVTMFSHTPPRRTFGMKPYLTAACLYVLFWMTVE